MLLFQWMSGCTELQGRAEAEPLATKGCRWELWDGAPGAAPGVGPCPPLPLRHRGDAAGPRTPRKAVQDITPPSRAAGK